MPRISLLVLLPLVTLPLAGQTCNLPGPPEITHLLNGASFGPFGFSANGLATVFGRNLQVPGERAFITGNDITRGADQISRFPTTFSCLAIEVNGRRAPILYAEASQVNLQIPSIPDLGNVPVVAILNPGTPNEKRSAPFMLRLERAGPGAFRFGLTECIAATFNDTGGYAADPVFVPGVGARIPRIGEIITVYVTGLGLVEPFWQAGEVPNRAAVAQETVQILLNGTIMNQSDIFYAGLSPGSISGLNQVTFRVPTSARQGTNNNIQIISGGFRTQEGITLPVQ